MWGAFRKMMTGLVMGDTEMVVDALSEEPSGKPPACAICAAKRTHEPHAPACGTRDGDFACVGHGEDGACVMARQAP